MSIRATITTTSGTRVSINDQQRTQVRQVGIFPNGDAVDRIVELNDVQVSGSIANNHTLVYDESLNKFVIKELTVVDGGTF